MDKVIKAIREIQIKEGHKPCFDTGKPNCLYRDRCCWSSICGIKAHRIEVR